MMKILFVDDEERRVETYVDEFKEQTFEVVFESDVDKAVDFLDKLDDEIDLLILDVMMATGNAFNDEETDYGMRTGIAFHRKIRQANPHLPVIILTNVADQELEEEIAKSRQSHYLLKENYLPHELVDKAKELLLRT